MCQRTLEVSSELLDMGLKLYGGVQERDIQKVEDGMYIGSQGRNYSSTRVPCAASGTDGEKDLIQRACKEKQTYNLASGESGDPPALHDRKTIWLLSARTFIGRSHMRSLGNSYTGEFDQRTLKRE